MKLLISREKISNAELFIRRCGYGRIFDRRNNQISYARTLRGALYPRFHLYMAENEKQYIFNLHLDQRPTRYEGVTAHSGEYDGAVVENEIARIKSYLI